MALLMLGTDKASDKMQMWGLNTQFNVFGIFRVAVEEAEEQLGPLGPSFAAQPRQDCFLNHELNLARATEMKHPPARKTMLIPIHRASGSDGATKAEWPEWKAKPSPRRG